MTQEDILEMVRIAGLTDEAMELQHEIDAVMRFAELVAAAEREACAKVCEEQDDTSYPRTLEEETASTAISVCAAAIRARGDL